MEATQREVSLMTSLMRLRTPATNRWSDVIFAEHLQCG
jgi:hypothetical protein